MESARERREHSERAVADLEAVARVLLAGQRKPPSAVAAHVMRRWLAASEEQTTTTEAGVSPARARRVVARPMTAAERLYRQRLRDAAADVEATVRQASALALPVVVPFPTR